MAIYLVTGATGYIGSMLVKYLKAQDKKNEIVALVRSRKKAEDLLGAGVNIIELDLADGDAVKAIRTDCDHIIHCASCTRSLEMVTHPVEVIKSIVNTTQNVLELAKRRRLRSMVYLSSMEVYGQIDCPHGHRVSEEEPGKIEILNVRSCYPLGKCMAENICCSYFREYGIPVKIARLAQTFGQGILPGDNRVFVQFAKAAKQGTDIVLHTKGGSMGNYCGIHDAVQGILMILRKGADGEAYNVVNEENTMTIRQMAELVAERIAKGKIKIIYEIPKENVYGYAKDTNLRLSGRKLMALGWKPEEDLEKMYLEVVEELQNK